MSNPFHNRAASLNGPARDLHVVTPSDSTDLPEVAVAFYASHAGDVTLITVNDQTRTVAVGEFMIVPVGVKRILATGTTATGIHVFTVS